MLKKHVLSGIEGSANAVFGIVFRKASLVFCKDQDKFPQDTGDE
jgi:hypothetical protein